MPSGTAEPVDRRSRSAASEGSRVEEVGETYSRRGDSFCQVHAEEMGTIGYDEVISGRQIEFEEIEEGEPAPNGSSPQRLDLLKGEAVYVAAVLERIELPLGQVSEMDK